MEVKKGYKQTEIGVIPEDWDEIVFNNIYLEHSRNGIYKSQEFLGRGTRLVNMGELFGFEFISNQEMKRVELTAKEASSFGLQDGDLLFGRRSVVPSGAGKCALVVTPEEPLTFESSIIRVRPNQSKAHPLFYYYFFTSLHGRHIMSSIISGTNVTGIRASELKELKVPFPEIAEQRAIAAALSDVDALLNSLDAIIAKKRLIKQGAMQELLTGKKRLPGLSGEWEKASIAELEKKGYLKLSRGEVISKKDIDNIPGDYPIYSSSIKNSGLFGNYGKFMFDEELITWSVDGGGNFFYRHKHKFSVTNVSGFMRVDTSIFSYRFLAYELEALHSHLVFDYQTKAHPSVIRKAYEVLIPSLKEQTAIVEILSDMDAEISALEQKREKTRLLKQGMMQELLTGRIRLV